MTFAFNIHIAILLMPVVNSSPSKCIILS